MVVGGFRATDPGSVSFTARPSQPASEGEGVGGRGRHPAPSKAATKALRLSSGRFVLRWFARCSRWFDPERRGRFEENQPGLSEERNLLAGDNTQRSHLFFLPSKTRVKVSGFVRPDFKRPDGANRNGRPKCFTAGGAADLSKRLEGL